MWASKLYWRSPKKFQKSCHLKHKQSDEEWVKVIPGKCSHFCSCRDTWHKMELSRATGAICQGQSGEYEGCMRLELSEGGWSNNSSKGSCVLH